MTGTGCENLTVALKKAGDSGFDEGVTVDSLVELNLLHIPCLS